MQKLTAGDALQALAAGGTDFVRLLDRDGFDVGLYKPDRIDAQSPHARDELYVVAAGEGRFRLADEVVAVAPGDVLFAPAGAVHRFEDFSADFATWVIFIGARPGKA